MTDVTVTEVGECQCGAISFKLDGPIKFSMICHCKPCSRFTGSQDTHLVGISNEYFSFSSGEDKLKIYEGKLVQAFCGECGSPIYQHPPGADFKAVYPTSFRYEQGEVGCLLPEDYKPTARVNYENRLFDVTDTMPKFKTWPSGEKCENDGKIIS
ncbi:unnamed protein product [Chrysoparadoxa australica]